jgi:hypothetical protein
MRAALRVVEPKLARVPGTLAEEARRRLQVATHHLEKAIALWRRALEERAQGTSWRKTKKMSRRHVRHSRKQWMRAVRMLETA